MFAVSGSGSGSLLHDATIKNAPVIQIATTKAVIIRLFFIKNSFSDIDCEARIRRTARMP
jgi:hypothetical protein